MAKRNTLHINKLEDFKTWLDAHGILHQPGKGSYEVLKVWVKDNWANVYTRHDMKEHYTVQEKLLPLVRRFIKETKPTPKVYLITNAGHCPGRVLAVMMDKDGAESFADDYRALVDRCDVEERTLFYGQPPVCDYNP